MDIIEKYGDTLKSIFMVDQVASSLFYTVFYNFDYLYVTFLKPKYATIISQIIEGCLKCYEDMQNSNDLPKVIECIYAQK